MARRFINVDGLKIEAMIYPSGQPPCIAPIVDGVSFTLEQGRVLGLIGESGAGKSSIGLAVLGYGRGGCRIVGGSIEIEGTDIRKLTAAGVQAIRGRRVTYVAQSAASSFNPAQRIGDQVIEATLLHGLAGRREALAWSVSLFEMLGLPSPKSFGACFPHQVSGGQLQRAMTAMALCPRPGLIVFDEPTTALDVTTQIDVLAAIKRAIEETSTAALYITHDLAIVAQIADDIMVLRHGKMVEYGPARQIIEAPRQDYTRRLLSVRRAQRPPSPAKVSSGLLEIAGVTAGYGNTPILHDVSLTLPAGQTVAIVGESGSGKSTLARVAMGLLVPDQGKVMLKGGTLAADYRRRSREELRALQLIYQMADVAMNPRQTVRQIIGRPLSFYSGLRGSDCERRVFQLLDQVDIPRAFIDRYPAELSGGQKQRVCIARALAADPEIIICDEPTSALDPLIANDILTLLKEVQDKTQVSYLFITHDIATVRTVADYVVVMHKGRVVRFGPTDKALSPPFDDYTERLLSSVPEMRIGWLNQAIKDRLVADEPDVV
jgi:peptide/nickel transport system ATP-binding protein